MPRVDVVRESPVAPSARVAQVAAECGLTLGQTVRHEWHVALPLHERAGWQIGLIVGPSGCGKSTIAQALWPDAYVRQGYQWTDQSVLDNFPADMEGKRVIQTLTSVGFSSPPDWVKPYRVLSTGQQMRCDLARAIGSTSSLVVFDEFTSVVDRTVARVGSAALARAIRRERGQQFVAVTCHDDVTAWLTPDWVYEPHLDRFQWRQESRPVIRLDLYPVHWRAWHLFKQYHYLSAELNHSAQCYLAEWSGTPVAFVAILPVIGFKNTVRASRSVVLPDYQGIGIGNALMNAVAQMYLAQGKRFRATTSHPSYIAHRRHDPAWRLVKMRNTGYSSFTSTSIHSRIKNSSGRAVCTFEYVGEAKGTL